MSDSSSSSTSFVLILLALGACVWLVQQAFTEPSKPAPTTPAAVESSTYSRAVDYSNTNGEALNNSMSDQIKSVQQMTGGTFDGQTYVLPQGK